MTQALGMRVEAETAGHDGLRAAESLEVAALAQWAV